MQYGEACGVVKRQHDSEHQVVDPPPVDVIRDAISEELAGEACEWMRNLFLSILDDPNPDEDTLIKRDSIMNGSFKFGSRASTTFPFIKEVRELHFGSSHFKTMGFDRQRFDALLQKAVDKGIRRERAIGCFISSWCGWDGSMFKSRCELIVPDDEAIKQLFRDMFRELFGNIKITEIFEASKIPNGKDIVKMQLYSTKVVYEKLIDYLGEWVPSKKAKVCAENAGII